MKLDSDPDFCQSAFGSVEAYLEWRDPMPESFHDKYSIVTPAELFAMAFQSGTRVIGPVSTVLVNLDCTYCCKALELSSKSCVRLFKPFLVLDAV